MKVVWFSVLVTVAVTRAATAHPPQKTDKEDKLTFGVTKDGRYEFYLRGRRIAYSKPSPDRSAQTLYAVSGKTRAADTAILKVTPTSTRWLSAYWQLNPPLVIGLVDRERIAFVLRIEPDANHAGHEFLLPELESTLGH